TAARRWGKNLSYGTPLTGPEVCQRRGAIAAETAIVAEQGPDSLSVRKQNRGGRSNARKFIPIHSCRGQPGNSISHFSSFPQGPITLMSLIGDQSVGREHKRRPQRSQYRPSIAAAMADNGFAA